MLQCCARRIIFCYRMKKLVIVESPTKAKTISRFLGKEYIVEASFGHVRDLPKKKLGVDVDHGFMPEYVVERANQKRLTALKKKAQSAGMVYYATDEDREGEAISWHLAQLFGLPAEKEQRIVFHEITPEAITTALANPRQLDLRLVDAQQARRVLDRLVGYKLSPFLWRKVVRGLSAGRVQSVAVRLIVEREREITAFTTREYWTIAGLFTTPQSDTLPTQLVAVDGTTLDKFALQNQAAADGIVQALSGRQFQVAAVEEKVGTRQPPAPFRTATLQQAANQRLGFSAKLTMMVAQQLYEGVVVNGEQVGLITYMRTDSLNLAERFLQDAAAFIEQTFGASSVGGPRRFTKKAKGAQEAHEAIRPTDVRQTPEQLRPFLSPQQWKLYNLIWSRSVASQMAPAKVNATAVDVVDGQGQYRFRATGQTIAFPGFLAVYPSSEKEVILPPVTEGAVVTVSSFTPEQHFTQPPARYSDATLVKALEERGIGRPSTYAPTIATIITRGYVTRDARRLKPTDVAFLVNDLLVEHFPEIVDYDFTAQMEEKLDRVATGELPWEPVIADFYGPFADHLAKKDAELKKSDLTTQASDEVCEKCGKPMVVKFGRFGKFLACTGYPECKNTKELGSDGAPAEPLPAVDETCPNCGQPMAYRRGRFGTFIACSNYPTCKTVKKTNRSTGVACPECGEGELTERRGRSGPFYGCSRYPKCRYTLNRKPTGEKCATCNALLVTWQNETGEVRCSNKDCPTRTKEGE